MPAPKNRIQVRDSLAISAIFQGGKQQVDATMNESGRQYSGFALNLLLTARRIQDK